MRDLDLAKKKAESDFLFLKPLINLGKANNWRIVVSGGYGMDLFFNKITRFHNDLDIIVYGKGDRDRATKLLVQFILQIFPEAKMTIKREMFYAEVDAIYKKFSVNIYFVETIGDPFTNLKTIRKLNGEIITNKISEFPMPVMGKIGDLEVEVQDQNAHLADILKRKGDDEAPNRRDQDIINLRRVTDPKKIESLLKYK